MAQLYVRYRRLGVVLFASAAFLLLSLYLKTWTEHNVFPVLFPAVVLSAWVGGRMGGLISTLALSLGTAYYHLPPEGFGVSDTGDLIRLGTFTVSGTFVAWLSGALKESKGVMMATLQSIGDGVIATDRRGRIRFLNPVAEELTGWSEDEARGRPLAEVFKGFHAETGESLRVPDPMTLHGIVNLENTCLVSKDGQQVAVDDSLAPVQIESGRIFGSILVFRDATKRKQNEAALLDAQRQRLQAQRMEAIGRLAGGVAHDFNNLLTIISGYADLSLRQMAHGTPGRNAVEEIRKAGNRASDLTRQLLVFSRGQPSRLAVVDLNQVVENFEPMLRRLIGEDITIVTNLSPVSVNVEIDVGQIEQVIMNLAVNARDAMPGGGRLTLEVNRREEYGLLAVKDTGIGFDEQTKAHLFEPFFTTKEVGKGTGLGLSVIYGVVQNHKGHLNVTSHPGEGSVFEVCLPLAGEMPAVLEPSPAAVEVPRRPGTILLVEDSPEVRKLMGDILISLGYVVMQAADADEALSLSAGHKDPIDLLVADLVMPGLSGMELAKRLAPLRPQMRVLYVSGYADHETATRALDDPTVGYLPKPFAVADLARKVQDMITRKQ